uniref:Chromodomain protein putative n=1 Tax=Albugo laibachii Nc14 TaxID=890382 RepID=F0VZW1_9STRA|nr:chromodomain protein putative [Albugo laibachii Nc14]|eukprot:CCA14332.1 chromodomain protein putative [Albugo laibachii Nc14]
MDKSKNADSMRKPKLFSILSDGIDNALRTIVPNIIKTHHCAGFPLSLGAENVEKKSWIEAHDNVVKHYEKRQKVLSSTKENIDQVEITEKSLENDAVKQETSKDHSDAVVDDGEEVPIVIENESGDGSFIEREGFNRIERRRKNRIVYEESSSEEEIRTGKKAKAIHHPEKKLTDQRRRKVAWNAVNTKKHTGTTMFDRLARVTGCEGICQGTKKYEILKDWIEKDQRMDLMLSNDVILWMKSQMHNDSSRHKESSKDENTGATRKKWRRSKTKGEYITTKNNVDRMIRPKEISACADNKETILDKAERMQKARSKSKKGRKKKVPIIGDEGETKADSDPIPEELASVQNNNDASLKEAKKVADVTPMDVDRPEESKSNSLPIEVAFVHNSDGFSQEAKSAEDVTEKNVVGPKEEPNSGSIAEIPRPTDELFSLDDPDVFVIESVLQERISQNKRGPRKGGRSTFLVKWEGYDEVTWEPEDNIPKWVVQSYRSREKMKTQCKHVFDRCSERKIVENKTAHTPEVIYHVWWKDAKEPDWESKIALPNSVVKALEKSVKAERLAKKARSKKNED